MEIQIYTFSTDKLVAHVKENSGVWRVEVIEDSPPISKLKSELDLYINQPLKVKRCREEKGRRVLGVDMIGPENEDYPWALRDIIKAFRSGTARYYAKISG